MVAWKAATWVNLMAVMTAAKTVAWTAASMVEKLVGKLAAWMAG